MPPTGLPSHPLSITHFAMPDIFACPLIVWMSMSGPGRIARKRESQSKTAAPDGKTAPSRHSPICSAFIVTAS